MKKIIIFFSFLFLIICLKAQTINEPYDFPVKPGSLEWKKLKSGKEMAEVCSIPDPILSLLTTEALAKSCLSYPLLNEVFYANNFQKGIEGVIKNFNGLSELLKRKDAGQELFKIYKNKNVKDLNENSSEVQQGLFSLDFTYLELLLSQPQILNNLSSKERTELVKEAITKYDNKKEKIDVFGEAALMTSVFVIARVLNTENKLAEVLKTVSQKEINMFLATTRYSNSLTVSAIYNAGKSL